MSGTFALKEEGEEKTWPEQFKENYKARRRDFITIADILKKEKAKEKKNCDFMVNYKKLLGSCRLLRPLTASLLTFRQPFSTSPAPQELY